MLRRVIQRSGHLRGRRSLASKHGEQRHGGDIEEKIEVKRRREEKDQDTQTELIGSHRANGKPGKRKSGKSGKEWKREPALGGGIE